MRYRPIMVVLLAPLLLTPLALSARLEVEENLSVAQAPPKINGHRSNRSPEPGLKVVKTNASSSVRGVKYESADENPASFIHLGSNVFLIDGLTQGGLQRNTAFFLNETGCWPKGVADQTVEFSALNSEQMIYLCESKTITRWWDSKRYDGPN